MKLLSYIYRRLPLFIKRILPMKFRVMLSFPRHNFKRKNNVYYASLKEGIE